MSTESLAVYNDQLEYILSDEGQFTTTAIFDPSGDAQQEISGIFTEYTFRGEKDSGNVKQKKITALFIVKDAPEFDVYDNKILQIKSRNYTIDYIDKDTNGAQVLWLY